MTLQVLRSLDIYNRPIGLYIKRTDPKTLKDTYNSGFSSVFGVILTIITAMGAVSCSGYYLEKMYSRE